MSGLNPKSIFTAPNQFPNKNSGRVIQKPKIYRSFSESAQEDRRKEILAQHRGFSSDAPNILNTTPFPESVHGPERPPSASRNEYAIAIDDTPPKPVPQPNPVVAGVKRRPSPKGPTRPGASSSDRPHKRRRTLAPSGASLDFSDLPAPSSRFRTPPSPLFFSNTPQPRPALPPRFSSSEAAARMLSKTQNEDQGIKTVTLARATQATSSPPSTGSSKPLARSRMSIERNSLSRDTPEDASPMSESSRALDGIGVAEILETDDRPTFVIDLADPANYGPGPIHLVYANPALRNSPDLVNSVIGRLDDDDSRESFAHFKTWVSATKQGFETPSSIPGFPRSGILWSHSTLRKRMRVVKGRISTERNGELLAPGSGAPGSPISAAQSISVPIQAVSDLSHASDYFGNVLSPPAEMNRVVKGPEILRSIKGGLSESQTPPSDSMSVARNGSESNLLDEIESTNPSAAILSAACAGDIDRMLATGEKEIGFFDWTRVPQSDALPKHIKFARSVDWASTALGPIETWNADLRQMCNLIMASPHPAAMYWGEDLVAIYNEAYVMLAGQKHPELMGRNYRDAWAEIWDEVKDVFASAQTTGQATMKDDDCLFIKRNSFLEETYFSWSIIPMVGGDGTVQGLYNPAFEKTRRKIAERRMLTLREVGERTATARDVKAFWAEVLAALEVNEYDTPFVLLYSLHGELDSDESSVQSTSVTNPKQCYLEGSLGVPEGHEAAPQVVDLASTEGFVPVFRDVIKTNRPRVLDVTHGELPPRLMQGFEERGFNDPPTAAVICPIHPTTGESTLGFLVMGINPRRPYDEDYALFVQLLSRQLATSLASVVLFEEEIKRGQRAAKLAAIDKIQLSDALAARTQEAIESENKFTRMAEFAPVGMFITDRAGVITFSNDTWHDISRIPKGLDSDRWLEFVHPDDHDMVNEFWQELISKTRPSTSEFRFKAPWIDRNGVSGSTWVLISGYPETYDDGSLKSVFGSITNISQQKWAEGLQKKKMEEAVELKRQQENFIDITSHEMRNPLSAILQCADELTTSITIANNKRPNSEGLGKLFGDCLEAASTIALCAQHQKRIVDDVLTLSKLDSALLMVTPVDAQPLAVVHRALKMFEGEFKTGDIELKFMVDPSYKKLNIDWVKFDPSRVLQVLINLTTNAIKFTTTESQRTITVTLAASTIDPLNDQSAVVSYVPSRSPQSNVVQAPGWGTGEEIFIQFSVKDTGRGLSEEEKKLLFLRFSQASPRTHVQYGGSGLGLFISHQLVELQGGSIGVASEAGQGSTFAFFVKGRRTDPPANPVDPLPNLQGRKSNAEPRASKQPPSHPAANSPKRRDFAVPAGSSAQASSDKDPLKVLIVEDNLVNQKVLSKQLRNLGCIIHVANHGAEALDRLKESTFQKGAGEGAVQLDVVLMDQEMPVMDGLTCTRKIRGMEKSEEFTRHVPIIAVTANARAEQVKTAMEAGMDDVVSKPFRIPELVPKMEELSNKYRELSMSKQ